MGTSRSPRVSLEQWAWKAVTASITGWLRSYTPGWGAYRPQARRRSGPRSTPQSFGGGRTYQRAFDVLMMFLRNPAQKPHLVGDLSGGSNSPILAPFTRQRRWRLKSRTSRPHCLVQRRSQTQLHSAQQCECSSRRTMSCWHERCLWRSSRRASSTSCTCWPRDWTLPPWLNVWASPLTRSSGTSNMSSRSYMSTQAAGRYRSSAQGVDRALTPSPIVAQLITFRGE